MDQDLKEPTVSVVLPVYNAVNYVNAAINSILQQTYKNLELIIINDASNDGTTELIEKITDARVKVLNHSENMGLVASLNEGIHAANGKYIARMDADDISAKCRIEKQVSFLEKHNEYGLCGSYIQVFGEKEFMHRYPSTDDAIRFTMLFHCPFAHPAVMWNNSLFKRYGLTYQENFSFAEDYELWTRAVRYMKMANIREPLLQYRSHEMQLSELKKSIQEELSLKAATAMLADIGIIPDDPEKLIHKKLMFNLACTSHEELFDTGKWLQKIKNAAVRKLDTSTVEKEIARIWTYAVARSRLGSHAISIWKDAGLHKYSSLRPVIRMLINNIAN